MANNGLILLPARLRVTPKPPSISDVSQAMFLNYGAELELVLIPKSHIANNWDDVAKHLSTALTERRIPNEILEDSKTASFEKWIITGDGSVERDTKVNKWGLELISCIRVPFFDWRGMCSKVWDALTDRFEIAESDTCGTHVHVSWMRNNKLVRGDPLELLKYMAKAVVYFERCIDSLMPRHRLNNPFCRSNRYNVRLRSYTISQIFEIINEIEPEPETPEGPNGYERLVDLLCPDDGNQTARCYKWNFTPLLREDATKRTIEFRQPPGSLNLDDTVFWCQFVHTFTFAALFPSYWNPWPPREASLDELRQMLKQAGAEKRTFCEYEERLFEQAFKDKSLLPDNFYEEIPFTSEDLTQIRSRDRVEELKMQRAEASMAENTSEDGLPFPVAFSDDEDE